VTENGSLTPDVPQAGPEIGSRPVARDIAPPPSPPELPPLPPARAPEAIPPTAPIADPAVAATGVAAAAPDAAGSSKESHSFARWAVEFVVLVLAAFLLATGIKTWVVQPFYIPSGSMEPTLAIGDRVLVNKFLYRFSSPHRGDVVVFASPESPQTDLIKRVIAVGGQTVEIREGYVYVNGIKIDEPYIASDRRDTYTSASPTRVPAGYVWVMGDNRGNSSDSRVIGPQPVSAILGKAFAIYWPIQRMGGL
jgi:signal peptidase I